MSYDLYLYPLPAGADPLHAGRAAFEAIGDPPPPPDAPERMARLASALHAHHPTLAVRSGGEGAKAYVLLESAASGIQVWLFPTHASVDVAYWHSGVAAVAALREAWNCLEVLARETTSCIYDPQGDCGVDLRADFDAVLSRYAGGVQTLEEILANPPRRD